MMAFIGFKLVIAISIDKTAGQTKSCREIGCFIPVKTNYRRTVVTFRRTPTKRESVLQELG
jgi:hypothetical protein